MEMCWTVVAEVHSNHYPKESSYLRHSCFRFYSLRTRCVRSRIGPRLPLRESAGTPVHLRSRSMATVATLIAVPAGL
jgi:hypothetical protein